LIWNDGSSLVATFFVFALLLSLVCFGEWDESVVEVGFIDG